MSGNYIYKTKSKSKTFQKSVDSQEVFDYILNNIETEIHQLSVPWEGEHRTKFKYIVTVTKVIE